MKQSQSITIIVFILIALITTNCAAAVEDDVALPSLTQNASVGEVHDSQQDSMPPENPQDVENMQDSATPTATLEPIEENSTLAPETTEEIFTGRMIYVATTGNNQNGGQEGSPLRTINYALRTAAPGDRVVIRGGNYDETVEIKNIAGSEGAPITIMPYPEETVIISADDWVGLIILGSSWVEVVGLNVTNASIDGIYISNSNHITVRNCGSYNNSGIGIHLTSLDGPTNGNIVQDCDVHDNGQEGIYLDVKQENPVSVDNNVIEGNRIYGNGREGIQNTNQNGVPPFPSGTVIRENQIENNGADWATMDISGENLLISSNYIVNQHAPSGGVYIGYGQNVQISGNVIHTYYANWDGGDAIVLDEVSNILVEGNKIISLLENNSLGINVLKPGENIALVNNCISTNPEADLIIQVPFKELCEIIKNFEYCEWSD